MATERIQRQIDRLSDQVEKVADQEDWEAVRTLAQQVLDLARTMLTRRPSRSAVVSDDGDACVDDDVPPVQRRETASCGWV